MTPLTRAKIAELTPMAIARVRTAMAVKPGVFISCRKANLKSCIIVGEMPLTLTLDSGILRIGGQLVSLSSRIRRSAERDLAIERFHLSEHANCRGEVPLRPLADREINQIRVEMRNTAQRLGS